MLVGDTSYLLQAVDPASVRGSPPSDASSPASLAPQVNAPQANAPPRGVGGQDRVELSPAARTALQSGTASAAEDAQPTSESENGAPGELSEEEQAAVSELQARDREVRAHEEAHARVGGQYAGAPTYDYQQGPDGRRYAVGGQVSIDTAPIDGDPQATIDKLQQVKRAALAPAEPSGQDRSVAAQAEAGIMQARGELTAQRAEALSGGGDDEAASEIGGPSSASEAQGASEAPETSSVPEDPASERDTADSVASQNDLASNDAANEEAQERTSRAAQAIDAYARAAALAG